MSDYSEEQIHRAFEQVEGHVLHLHGYWRLFRKLYRGNADSSPVLSAVASQVFAILDRSLRREVFLFLRQLTDAPVSMKRRNASLRGLLLAVEGDSYPTTQSDMVSLIEAIEGNKTIRTHVNRYVAHLDFDLLAGVAEPPDSVEILDVERALESLRAFMDEFSLRFLDGGSVDYETAGEILAAQIDDMVQTLRLGLLAQGRLPT